MKTDYKKIDDEIKISKYYDSEKMKSAIMNMEQFYMFSQDTKLDTKNKICAYKMFEHYRRLAMCILMKEFEPNFKVSVVIDKEYMENVYRSHWQNLDDVIIKTPKN